MGAEIYPVFSPHVPSADFAADGKLLLREFESLDRLAADLGVALLSAFGGNQKLPDDFDGDPDELDEVLGEWDEWFSIDDGLRTINGLIEGIKCDSDTVAELQSPDDIAADLESLARALRIAEKHGAKFRLEVG